MKLAGKIIAVLDKRGGTSKNGNTWAIQEYVVEWKDGEYPRRCKFSVFGTEKIQQFGIRLNAYYEIECDVNAQQYNGNWYNEIRAWLVREVKPEETKAEKPSNKPVEVETPPSDITDEPTDDLPF